MDPFFVSIVTALSAGALAAAKDVATSAVKDAYQGLKKLVTDRYQHAAPAVAAVEAHPDSEQKQKDLAVQLSAAAPAPDPEQIKAMTQKLLQAIEDLRREAPAQTEAMFDFKKLRAAKNFELSDIEFSGTILRADEANFEGDFKATGLRRVRH
jgi:hypothetical protein